MEEGELETMPKLENEDMVVVLAQERSRKSRLSVRFRSRAI